MTVRESRFEPRDSNREFKTNVDPSEREARVRTTEAPVATARLQADAPKSSIFGRLLNGGLSALDHATSGLQMARGAVTSLRQTSFSAATHELTTGPSKLPTAPVFEHPSGASRESKSAENHDREATPSRNINITLFQVNVNNEKGPGVASQVVSTFAGALGSLASARHGLEETKSDAPKASGLGARALSLGFSALKLGASTFKKHVLE